MLNATETRKKTTWSTWEELLLAFAVKRHGLNDWDSVAMELQNRCSIPAVITAQICKDKYHDLHRRFMNNDAADGGDDDDSAGATVIPWLEELRQLRVAELKQEVHRYDLSIQSLQLKVKRLEEREDASVKPDLEDDGKEERSENDENNGGSREMSEEDVAGKDVSCKESDRENRSFNESNSTENRGTGEKVGPDSVDAGLVKPDPEAKPGWEEDSCNDSSDRHKRRRERKTDGESTAELRDLVSESKEGTKESSDVQSSASLTERRRRKRVDVSGGRIAAAASPAAVIKRGGAVKPEALVGILDVIRSHKHGQVFYRRLDSQKTENYKKIIRRHVDLETVQARIDDGSYSSCSNRFYMDLLLVFNNAIVFFPKSSHESTAAKQLRCIALNELKNRALSTDPSPEPSSTKAQPKFELERSDSLLAKHKSTTPIVVCRKRSSISAKTATSGNNNKQGKLSDEKPPLSQKPAAKSSPSTPEEDDSSTMIKTKEMPVTTGVRSTRRSGKGNPSPSQSTVNSNQNRAVKSTSGGVNKGEAAKTDKKEDVSTTTDKKRGAANFLKRMKKDSQGTTAKNSPEDGKAGSRREQQKRKQPPPADERKDGPLRRSGGGGGGGGSGKEAKEESSMSRRNVGRPPKRGREAATPEKRGKENNTEKEDSSKRPKKRSRR